MSKQAFLVGPFIGELSWELYRFAPYIIHLKKEFPTHNVIVFTRPSRFDLYGKYADILVPLKLINDNPNSHHCFTINNFYNEDYKLLVESFKKKYDRRFKISDHIYPDISNFYYKLKWQFSRTLMDYDFKPRAANDDLVNDYLKGCDDLVFLNDHTDYDTADHLMCNNFDIIKANELLEFVELNQNGNFNQSFIGCAIEAIRKCKFVVANVNSIIGHIAMLLKIPLISINEEVNLDTIKMANPFDSPVVVCENIESGIEYYENNL